MKLAAKVTMTVQAVQAATATATLQAVAMILPAAVVHQATTTMTMVKKNSIKKNSIKINSIKINSIKRNSVKRNNIKKKINMLLIIKRFLQVYPPI